MDLQNQKALVIGALGTAGTAIVHRFCDEGAAVVLCARKQTEGEALAASLQEAGHEAHFVQGDVTDKVQLSTTIDAAVEKLGRLDILVNSFSVDHLRRFQDDEEKHWDRMIDVNFKGTMNTCQEALRHMVPQGYGRIINLSSDSAKIGATMETAQSGTKAAVVAFTKSLAREMARHEITVNAVCLGPMNESSEPIPGLSEEAWKSFMRLIPFRRPAKPHEVSALVAFLAMRDASFVTGQAISTSGGLTMC